MLEPISPVIPGLQIEKDGWPWDDVSANEDHPKPDLLPRITLVTPSFNQGEHIEATIRSVLLQNYPNLEYLILDGGSTDASVSIIKYYEKSLNYWHSQADRGQSDAINQGLAMATGEIVGWLNSDDLLLPDALLTIGRYFSTRPETVLVYGRAQMISRDGTVLGDYSHAQPYEEHLLLDYDDIVPQPSAFIKRTAFAALGGLDVSLHYALDWDLWIRLGRYGAVEHIPNLLSQMRTYPEAKTYSGGQKVFNEIRTVVERYGGKGFPAVVRQWIALDQTERARQAFMAGEFAAGQQALKYLFDNAPEYANWDVDRWASLVADWAWGSLSPEPDPVSAAQEICRWLPANVDLNSIQRQALSLVYQSLAFLNSERGRHHLVLLNAFQAIRHDRQFLKNRGLMAVVTRSLLLRRSDFKSVRPQNANAR